MTAKKPRKTKSTGIFQGRKPNEDKVKALKAKIKSLQTKLKACGTKQTRKHKKPCKTKKKR